MPSLPVNTSVSVSLPAGSSINITGNGAWAFIATVSGREIASGSYVGPDVIGPFTRAAVVGLTATVSDGLQYTVADFVEGNSAAAALTTEQVTALQSVVSEYGNGPAFTNGGALREMFGLSASMRVAWIHNGDSNTAFGGRGWSWYLGSAAMRQFGAFGSGVFCISQGAVGMYQVAGGGGARASAANAALDQYAPYGLGDGCPSYMYVPSGSSEQIQSYVEALAVGYPHPADMSGALKFRISYGTFPSGSGSIQPHVRLDIPPYSDIYAAPSAISTNAGAYGIVDWSASVTADSARKGNLALCPGLVNGNVVGPAWVQYMSVNRSDKLAGVSFQTLYYRAGFSARDMLQQLTAWGQPALKEYLRQVRLTLTDSGQTRTPVVFSINQGMNDQNILDGSASLGPNPTTPGSSAAAYKDNIAGIMNLVSAAWASLGASSADLLFFLIPSHPVTSPDAAKLISYRAAAAELASPGSMVAAVDIAQLIPAEDYSTGSLWDSGGGAHLADVGYSTNALTLVSAIARDFPGTDNYQAKLPSSQAVAGQSTGEYRPDFSVGAFVSIGPIAVATLVQNPNVLPPAGVRVSVRVKQDGTGGRALSFDTLYKFQGGALTNTGNTANKATICDFVSDGTNLVSLSQNAWY